MKRNKLSRRDFLHLSAVTGTGALLAACQLPVAPAGEGGAAAPPAVTTTINFWDFPYYSSALGEAGSWQWERANAFMAENPSIEVEVLPLTWEQGSKVTTALAAGSPPDVVGGGWIQLALSALEVGLALDLTDSLEEQLTSDMVDGMLEQCSIDGRVYMVPYWPVCQSGVVYLDGVEEAGAMDLGPQAPCYGWNIEQFSIWLEGVRGTRPDGSERYGLGIPSAHSTPAFHWVTLMYFRCFGAFFWTDETESCVDFASPEAIKCLAWMQELAERDLIPDPAGYTGDDNNALIDQGNVLMQVGNVVPGGARQEGMELDAETLVVNDTVNERSWRFIQYPHDDPHPAIAWGGANYSGLVPFKPEDPADIPGLLEFIHWMTNKESEEWLVKSAGMLPFRKSILEEVADDPLVVYTSECLMPNAWFDAKRSTETIVVRSIFEEHFQGAFSGKSAEQVMQEMTDDINSTLESCA